MKLTWPENVIRSTQWHEMKRWQLKLKTAAEVFPHCGGGPVDEIIEAKLKIKFIWLSKYRSNFNEFYK